MSDLIDFNSSTPESDLFSKLASPLIPAPRTIEKNILATTKRDSLENNPFDMVLRKTAEYICKQNDPFDLTLEKARKSIDKMASNRRKHSVEFIDDFTMKRRRTSDKLKLNKTLDESLIVPLNECAEESIITDLNNTNLLSGMNDTLPKINVSSDEKEIQSTIRKRISMCIQNSMLNVNSNTGYDMYLKPPILRRSFSCGEKISPKKSVNQKQRSHSTISGSKNNLSSTDDSKISFESSNNPFNTGFVQSQYSDSAVSSSLSNISAVTRLSSVSFVHNTSSTSITTNGTMNRAFLNSCSSEKASSNVQFDVSDLMERFNKLKTKSVELDIPKEKNILTFDSNKQKSSLAESKFDMNDKLIDVEVFAPEEENTREENKSSFSNSSYDSVFSDSNKTSISIILHEAKCLSRKFAELSCKADSTASSDDLLSSNPLWSSKLLPAFDDEVTVNNLIELPESPNTHFHDADSSNKKHESINENSQKSDIKNSRNSTKEDENFLKKLEMEFIEPVSADEKITASILLMDLKKLVNTENNIKATKLLENLEKVLGVECKDNTELLSTCLGSTNNLNKSPQKSDGSLQTIENVKVVDNTERSREDNLDVDSAESIKELGLYNNMNVNHPSVDKVINIAEKSLEIHSSNKSENVCCVTDASNENSPEDMYNFNNISENKNLECAVDSPQKTSPLISDVKNYNKSNGHIVKELLINLGKVLSGQCQESTTLDLFKNLGIVLDLASNNSDPENNEQTSHTKANKTPVRNVKHDNKILSEIISKSANMINSSSRSDTSFTGCTPSNRLLRVQSAKQFVRRSISVNHTSPSHLTPKTPTSHGKNKSQLKDVKKRFPSDPGFITSLSNKKVFNVNIDGKKQSETKGEIRKDKSPAKVDTVKSKLRKKSEFKMINKKGPMKAILPLKSMQRRGSIGRKEAPLGDTITPPKSTKTPCMIKIISSTPNSTDNERVVTKSHKSKPVASSTPDLDNSKTQKTQIQLPKNFKKRNISCDISPVSSTIKVSPKRIDKPSSSVASMRTGQTRISIPKYMASPKISKKNTSPDQSQGHFEASQLSVKKLPSVRRSLRAPLRKIDDRRRPRSS